MWGCKIAVDMTALENQRYWAVLPCVENRFLLLL
jgi:hypothetical protein